jgi:hypothetical protein
VCGALAEAAQEEGTAEAAATPLRAPPSVTLAA